MGIGFYIRGVENGASFSMSYCTFRRLREKIALSLNIPYQDMEGVVTSHPTDSGYYRQGWNSWENITSPLKRFLHIPSDTDEWSWEECDDFIPILQAILDLWEEDKEPHGPKSVLKELYKIIQQARDTKKSILIC